MTVEGSAHENHGELTVQGRVPNFLALFRVAEAAAIRNGNDGKEDRG